MTFLALYFVNFLGNHILHQIGDDIALGLELAGIEGNAARSLGPNADGVIHINDCFLKICIL